MVACSHAMELTAFLQLRQTLFQVVDTGAALAEGTIQEEFLMQRDIGFDAGDGHFGQRHAHARHRLFAGITISDQFTNHRVVVGRNRVTLVDVRVDADARATGRVVALDLARRRDEGERVFRVDAALHRVALEHDLVLGEAQFFAVGDADLLLHDVDAGDQLGNRVFHLHAGVHLDEVELAVFVQELKSTGAAVADAAAGFGAGLADALALFGGNARCRRFFDDLLVTALHRAITLAQVHGVAVLVGQHLDLDVARLFQEFFHVHGGVAKGSTGFGTGHVDRVDQRRFGVHHAHAATAAAAGSLDDHREADLAGNLGDFHRVVRQRASNTRYGRYTGFDHGLLGGHLVAHQADGFGARADEGKAGLLHALGEVGVFRQEAVTRVDGLGVGYFGGGNQRRHIQVALGRGCRADAHRFVGQLHVVGFAVGFGMHYHGLDAHLAAGTLDTQGNFTTVGDQDLFKHVGISAARCHAWAPGRAVG